MNILIYVSTRDSSFNIYTRLWACSTDGEKNAYRILVGKPEGNRPLGRPRRRWENNNRMDLREIGWGGMDWIDLAQYRDQ
jgi:hypothetical protein